MFVVDFLFCFEQQQQLFSSAEKHTNFPNKREQFTSARKAHEVRPKVGKHLENMTVVKSMRIYLAKLQCRRSSSSSFSKVCYVNILTGRGDNTKWAGLAIYAVELNCAMILGSSVSALGESMMIKGKVSLSKRYTVGNMGKVFHV